MKSVDSIMRDSGRNLLVGIGFVFSLLFLPDPLRHLAIRYVGRKPRLSQIAIASFTSLSIGHNVGGAALSKRCRPLPVLLALGG